MNLGRYSRDPRIKITKGVTWNVLIDNTVIETSDGVTWEVLADRTMADFDRTADYTGTLIECIEFVLGDPAQVGPSGFGRWLHTDGRTYSHDPATTGFQPADYLRAGDVVDFPHLDAFEILGPAETQIDGLGQMHMAFPVRRKNGARDWFPYRAGDMVPVRFKI